MLAIEAVELINPKIIEKMALAKRVGKFLNCEQIDEERLVVENIAKMLAEDVSAQVREVLAFELRSCMQLSPELSEKIATDIEDVSSSFLVETCAFSDMQMAMLIPALEEYAKISIARRSDLGEHAKMAIVENAGETAVTYLVRNDHIEIPEGVMDRLVDRFGNSPRLMDHMSAREDLPLSIVEQMVDLVSEHCRTAMVQHYAIEGSLADKLAETSKLDTLWKRISSSSPQQVHAFVTDMRANDKLNSLLVIEMGERGSRQFVYSFLALMAHVSIVEVKDILVLDCPKRFVELMTAAGVSNRMAPRFLRLAKLWQSNDNEAPVQHAMAVND